MKTQEHRIEDLQRSRFKADLEASINALFRRRPTLCGFTVRSHVSGLFVTGVSVHPLSGLKAPAELCDEIVATLVELIDECPDAYGLLRERTFARVFH
jgi:hypothetical protein